MVHLAKRPIYFGYSAKYFGKVNLKKDSLIFIFARFATFQLTSLRSSENMVKVRKTKNHHEKIKTNTPLINPLFLISQSDCKRNISRQN
jgi:hypothetical protein